MPGQTDPADLVFARADMRWRLLAADRRNWDEPDRRRRLAAVFLAFHAAKLALEDSAGLAARPAAERAPLARAA